MWSAFINSFSTTHVDDEYVLIYALQRRIWHRFILGVAIVVVGMSFLLQNSTSGGVRPSWAPCVRLPPLCGSRVFFGVECPGCGLTRSFVALAHFDWQQSVKYNRVGWLVAVAVVLQIPFRTYMLWELRRRVVLRHWMQWIGWALIAIMIVSWIGKTSGLY